MLPFPLLPLSQLPPFPLAYVISHFHTCLMALVAFASGREGEEEIGEFQKHLQTSKTPRGGSNNRLPYVYDLTNPAEEEQFVGKCKEYLIAQMTWPRR